MSTLLFLETRQFVNYIKLSFRSPKRLIPVIFFILWLLSITFNTWIARGGLSGHGRPPVMPGGPGAGIAWPILFGLGMIATFYMLVRSFSESLIVFGLPEMDFLFPTPVDQRLVMSGKLLKVYAKTSVMVVFWLLVMTPMMVSISAGSSSGALGFIGIIAALAYIVLLINVCTILNLIASHKEGGKWWLASAMEWAVYCLAIFAVYVSLMGYLRTGDVVAGLTGAATHPLFMVLLLPMKWAVDLAVSPITGWKPGFGAEFAFLCLLGIVSYALVLIRGENPYEPSLTISVRRAAVRAAIRSGEWGKAKAELLKHKRKAAKERTTFPPFGRGATAILWKNFNVSLRESGKQFVFLVVIIAIAAFASRIVFAGMSPTAVHIAAVGMLAYLVWIGSMFQLHRLRADLKSVNILKPMPIPAWQLISVQVLHGAILVSVFIWLAVGLIVILYGMPSRSPLVPAAFVFPCIVLASISSQAFVSVLYPDWGDVGQRFLGGMLSMLASMFAIGLPMGISALFWFLKVSPILWVPIVGCIALSISAGGIALGAYAFKRHDPTDE